MAKKKILACPACQAKLLQDVTQGTGILMVCPNCGSTVLADIDDAGRMRLSVEPAGEKAQPAQNSQYNK